LALVPPRLAGLVPTWLAALVLTCLVALAVLLRPVDGRLGEAQVQRGDLVVHDDDADRCGLRIIRAAPRRERNPTIEPVLREDAAQERERVTLDLRLAPGNPVIFGKACLEKRADLVQPLGSAAAELVLDRRPRGEGRQNGVELVGIPRAAEGADECRSVLPLGCDLRRLRGE
jgi:hypothetical protein